MSINFYPKPWPQSQILSKIKENLKLTAEQLTKEAEAKENEFKFKENAGGLCPFIFETLLNSMENNQEKDPNFALDSFVFLSLYFYLIYNFYFF